MCLSSFQLPSFWFSLPWSLGRIFYWFLWCFSTLPWRFCPLEQILPKSLSSSLTLNLCTLPPPLHFIWALAVCLSNIMLNWAIFKMRDQMWGPVIVWTFFLDPPAVSALFLHHPMLCIGLQLCVICKRRDFLWKSIVCVIAYPPFRLLRDSQLLNPR